MGNHGISAKTFLHTESSWRLNELTEGAVTIEVGSLFHNFTTRIEKDNFLRRQNWRNKKRGWGPDPILQNARGQHGETPV